MRWRASAVTALLLAGFVLIGLGASPPAIACSALPETPTEQQFLDQADVVFEGVALSSRNPNIGARIQSSGDPVFYTFAADRVLKGPVSSQPVVATAAGGASCGDTFTLGARYRIYARNVSGTLTTSSGTGNRLAPLLTTTTAPGPGRPSTAPPAAPRSGPVRLTG